MRRKLKHAVEYESSALEEGYAQLSFTDMACTAPGQSACMGDP